MHSFNLRKNWKKKYNKPRYIKKIIISKYRITYYKLDVSVLRLLIPFESEDNSVLPVLKIPVSPMH